MLKECEVHYSEEYDENVGGQGGRVELHSVFLLCSCVVNQHQITLTLSCYDIWRGGRKRMYLSFPSFDQVPHLLFVLMAVECFLQSETIGQTKSCCKP